MSSIKQNNTDQHKKIKSEMIKKFMHVTQNRKKTLLETKNLFDETQKNMKIKTNSKKVIQPVIIQSNPRSDPVYYLFHNILQTTVAQLMQQKYKTQFLINKYNHLAYYTDSQQSYIQYQQKQLSHHRNFMDKQHEFILWVKDFIQCNFLWRHNGFEEILFIHRNQLKSKYKFNVQPYLDFLKENMLLKIYLSMNKFCKISDILKLSTDYKVKLNFEFVKHILFISFKTENGKFDMKQFSDYVKQESKKLQTHLLKFKTMLHIMDRALPSSVKEKVLFVQFY